MISAFKFRPLHAGLKFWRVGSRKIFSVPDSETRSRSRKKRRLSRGSQNPQPLTDTSGDSDFELEHGSHSRRLRRSGSFATVVADELATMRESISRLHSTGGLPPGVRRHLENSFKCAICFELPTPPIVYSHCCHRIVGCQQCNQRWREEDYIHGDTCPL